MTLPGLVVSLLLWGLAMVSAVGSGQAGEGYSARPINRHVDRGNIDSAELAVAFYAHGARWCT
jgi:hypothetical protein